MGQISLGWPKKACCATLILLIHHRSMVLMLGRAVSLGDTGRSVLSVEIKSDCGTACFQLVCLVCAPTPVLGLQVCIALLDELL